MPMLRILFISSRLPSEGLGGAETAAFSIAESCAELGATVAVAGVGSPPYWKEPEDRSETGNPRLRSYRLSPTRLSAIQGGEGVSLLSRIFAHLIDLSPASGHSRMISIIRDFRPDVIVTNNVRGLGMGAVVACSRSSAKWIHIPHDVQLLTPSGLWYLDHRPPSLWDRSGVRSLYQLWTRLLFRRVDYVFAATGFILGAHLDRGFFQAAGAEVLRLPSMGSRHSSGVVTQGSAIEHSSGDRPLRIAMVGRLTDHKGIAWALAALQTSDQSLVVEICGTGDQADEVRLLAQLSPPSMTVNLHGQLELEQRDKVLAGVDLLIVPSLVQESLSLVIEEAASLGVPSIGSRSGGIPELVKSEWLFQPGDTEQLLEVVQRFSRVRPASTQIEVEHLTGTEFAARLMSRAALP